MERLSSAMSQPERLIIVYDDGYMEIAKYNHAKKSFLQFENLNEEQLETIRSLMLKKEDRMYQKIPKSIDMYMDNNNFSFVTKSHKRKLPFLKYTEDSKVSYVDTTLPDLYFHIKNNMIYPYVIHRNKLYYNPLPNITGENLCMGSSDKSYKKEPVLEKKIKLIESTFFESIFSHEIKFELLQSWFDGKPDIRLLTKVKNELW